jgi:membrane protein DedA with SNARE-associated domain
VGNEDGIGESIEDASEAIEEGIEALREEAHRVGWFRLEYAIFAALGVMALAYVAGYFLLGANLDSLKHWGYLGVFLIALAGSATIVLPTPSSVAIFSGGILLDPVFGVPAPLLVGLVAGLGDALGEFSGYALGYAGTDLLSHQRAYEVFSGWMGRNGTATIFFLSTFPNPFFDIAGAAAGATRMSPLRFFLATLAGKIVKDTFLAYGGSFSIGIAREVF